MTLDDWSKVASIIFYIFSTLAIIGAAVKYIWSRDHRSGETLQHLEYTFKQLHSRWRVDETGESKPGITRAVDKEAGESERGGLRTAIQKGLDQIEESRDHAEKAWIPRLDEFLRFLLMVAAMQKNGLLKKRVLWDAYHYWFRIVATDEVIRQYVRFHFPVLDEFLRKNQRQIRRYERLHSGSESAAKLLQQRQQVAGMRGYQVTSRTQPQSCYSNVSRLRSHLRSGLSLVSAPRVVRLDVIRLEVGCLRIRTPRQIE